MADKIFWFDQVLLVNGPRLYNSFLTFPGSAKFFKTSLLHQFSEYFMLYILHFLYKV